MATTAGPRASATNTDIVRWSSSRSSFLPADGTRADRTAKAAFNAKSRLIARLRRI